MSSYNVIGSPYMCKSDNRANMNALPYAFYRAHFFSDFDYVPFSINSPELERFMGYTIGDWRSKYLVSIRRGLFSEYKHRSGLVRKAMGVASEVVGVCSFVSAAWKYLKLARTTNNLQQSTNIPT